MQFERGNAIARKNSRTEAAVKARNRKKELFLSRYDDNKDEALLLYLKAIGATNALLMAVLIMRLKAPLSGTNFTPDSISLRIEMRLNVELIMRL